MADGVGSRWRPGGPAPAARDWARWAAGARQAANLRVAAPLRLRDLRGGPVLNAATPPEFDAQLTGSSGGAYSWVEAFPDPTGAWRTTPAVASGTLNAYEYNRAVVPVSDDGPVVRLREVLPGEFRFRYLKRGVNPPCPATFTPGVISCLQGTAATQVAGSTLTLRDSLGVIVPIAGADTCMTDAVGSGCTWNVTQGQSYTLTVDPPSGKPYYLAASETFTAACGDNRRTIRLPIADGYVCCPPCTNDTTSAAGIPIPTVLTLDYMKGTTPLTFTSSVTLGSLTYTNVWYGQASILSVCDDYQQDPYGNCANQGRQLLVVYFIFECNPPRLLLSVPGLCCPQLDLPLPPDPPPPQWSILGEQQGVGTSLDQSVWTCDPPHFVFHAPDDTVTHVCNYSNGVFQGQTFATLSYQYCVFETTTPTFTIYH